MIVVETIKSNKRLLLLVFFILLGPLMTHAQDVQIATPFRDSVVIEDAAGNVENDAGEYAKVSGPFPIGVCSWLYSCLDRCDCTRGSNILCSGYDGFGMEVES